MEQHYFYIVILIVTSFIGGAAFHYFLSRKKFKNLLHKATTDSLSGLLNFESFESKAEKIFKRNKDFGNGFSILLFDIDKLKAINDNFEYKYGDLAIKKLADFLINNFRASDLIARYKLGDEFVVLLENISEADLNSLIQRLNEDADLRIEEINKEINFSLGYSCFKSSDKTLRDTILRAEYNLKEAKSNKKLIEKSL